MESKASWEVVDEFGRGQGLVYGDREKAERAAGRLGRSRPLDEFHVARAWGGGGGRPPNGNLVIAGR